jgi:hypothetical protein
LFSTRPKRSEVITTSESFGGHHVWQRPQHWDSAPYPLHGLKPSPSARVAGGIHWASPRAVCGIGG